MRRFSDIDEMRAFCLHHHKRQPVRIERAIIK